MRLSCTCLCYESVSLILFFPLSSETIESESVEINQRDQRTKISYPCRKHSLYAISYTTDFAYSFILLILFVSNFHVYIDTIVW